MWGDRNFLAPMISAPIPGANSRRNASSMSPPLAEHLATPSGREHPLVQPLAGMAERRVERLAAGGETVERDGDMLDTGECHGWPSFLLLVALP